MSDPIFGSVGRVERRVTDRAQFKAAALEAAQEFWADRDRVQALVGLVLTCLVKEIEDGAGKAVFKGLRGTLRKIFWFGLAIGLVFTIGGPHAVVVFVKGVFAP